MSIKAAAIKWEGRVYSIPAPGRHDNAIALMVKENPDKSRFLGSEQGFVTSEGKFLDRIEAAAIAIKCGQIEKLNWPPDLYSEDLW